MRRGLGVVSLALLCIAVPLEALTITEVQESQQTLRIVLDNGYQQGLLIGTLLEIFRTEALENVSEETARTRELFLGKAQVIEAQADWCLAEVLGFPLEPLNVGQQARIKSQNTIRYVAASQRNLLIDLNAETTQTVQPGDVLDVFRPMELVHPVTQQTIRWLDPIGQVRILRVTPHHFTARAETLRTVKRVIAGDRLKRPGEEPQEIHVLRVLDDSLYLNRFPYASVGARGTLRSLTRETTIPLSFRIRAIFPHLVEVVCSEGERLIPGEIVSIELEEQDR